MEDEGETPLVLFMQLKTFDATPDYVEKNMNGSTVPVLQDTEELDLWGMYSTLWPHFDTTLESMYYRVVLVDRTGCVAALFGPLSDEDLEGLWKAALKQAWAEALHAECSASPVGNDRGAEPVEGTGPGSDLAEQAGMP